MRLLKIISPWLIGIWLIGSGLLVQAQATQGTISGRVTNAAGAPVMGATLLLEPNGPGTTADTTGQYELPITRSGAVMLRVSLVGYRTERLELRVKRGATVLRDIQLVSQTHDLAEVIVTGQSQAAQVRDAPIKAEVLDTRKIQQETSTLTEALNRTTGVKIRQMGGLGSSANVIVNGFSGRAVKFFKDDIPVDYLGEGFNVTLLPVNMLDRVEVYKGVLPTRLGADALGGAINLVTKKSYRRYVDVSYEYGSFNTNRLSINGFQKSRDDGRFVGVDAFYNYSDNNYRVTARVVDPQTSTRTNREVTRFHDAFSNGYGEVYGGWLNKPWADELRLSIAAFWLSKDQQHGAMMTDPFGEVVTRQQGFVPSVRYKKGWNNNRLTVDQFLVYSRIQNRVIDTCGCAYDWFGNKKTIPARTGEADANGSLSVIHFDNYTARTLVQYRLNERNRLEFNAVFSRYSRSGADPFGPVYFYSGRDILTVEAGYSKQVLAVGLETQAFQNHVTNNVALKRYRYRSNGTDGGFSSYDEAQVVAKGQNWGVADALKVALNARSFVRVSAEWAYRLPEQGEIFGDGQFLLSNFTLRPERSTNINLGYRYETPQRFSLEANTFYRITQDQIILVPVFIPFSQYNNVDKVRGYGLELDMTYQPTRWLSVNGNVTNQNLRLFGIADVNSQFLDGARLRNTPYFFGNLSLRTTHRNVLTTNDALRFQYYYSYTHNYYLATIPRSSEPTSLFGQARVDTDLIIPNQHLHSLGFSYAIHNDRISVGADVKNIFDSPLFDNFRVQRAGRSIHVKIRYLLN